MSRSNLAAVLIDHPELYGLPKYPTGEVVGPCVCGSWPGGKCFKCDVIPAAPAPTPEGADMTPTLYRMLLKLKKTQDFLEGNPISESYNAMYNKQVKDILKYWGYT